MSIVVALGPVKGEKRAICYCQKSMSLMRDRKLSPTRDRENAARGLSTFLLVAPFGSSRDGGPDAKDERAARAAFFVRFVLGNDDERLSKTGGTAISFYTKQIVAHRWRVVETMGAMDHHFEPFADRERSLNMTLPSSETPSFRLVSPASSAFQADRDDTRRRRRRPNAFAKQVVVDQLDHHRPGGNRVKRPVPRYCL